MSFEEAIPVKNTFIHYIQDDDDDDEGYQPMVVHYRTTSGRVQPPKQTKEEKMRLVLAEAGQQIEEGEFEQDTSPTIHQDLQQEESDEEDEEANDEEDEEEHGSLSITVVASGVSVPSMLPTLSSVTSMGSQEADGFGCDDGESGLPYATEEEKKAAHERKECRPCAYYLFKPDGCRKGEGCEFCHLCTREDAKRWKVMRQRDVRLAKKRQAAALRSSQDTSPAAEAAPLRPTPAARLQVPGGCYQSPRPDVNGFVVAPTFMNVAGQHQPIPV